jgi:signal transduction histidine kinase
MMKDVGDGLIRLGDRADGEPTWVGVTGAIAITVATLVVCWWTVPLLAGGVVAIALVGTTLCSLLFGFWPGMVAMILTAIELFDLFAPPALHWQVPTPRHVLQVLCYLLAASLIMVIATSRQRARRDLEATNADLQVAVASRDRLLAVVSHDLKSPLTAIVLSTDLLKTAAGKEPHVVGRIAGTIRASAQRMDTLICDLLDLTVLDQGTVKLNRKPLVAASALAQALTMQQPLAREKGINLVSQVADDLPAVLGDANRLQQVLSNLLGNAIKFTPPGGTVKLEARSQGPAELVVCVRGTGPGITADALPNLFDRYWMARYISVQGSGLGLSIAKAIIDAHGGRIWAENNPEGGATFCFTLPAIQDCRKQGRAA